MHALKTMQLNFVLSSCFIAILLFQYVLCEEASVGSLFHYTIHTDNFFDKYEPDASVVFRSSVIGKPGLPQWLQYVQRESLDRKAYIYGTPSNVDDWKLEIIGLNTFTYESSRVFLDISVKDDTDPLGYLATFFVSDKAVEDFLEVSAQEAFLSAVSAIWPDATLRLHKLKSGKELGLSAPLPTDENQKEGVAIVVGSSSPFSDALNESAGRCTKGGHRALGDAYSTTWCDIDMTILEATTPPQDAMNPPEPVFLGGEYNPPALPEAEESSDFLAFIFIVIVPFGMVVVIILVLGYMMYGRREGIKTRSSRASSLQLTHHIDIRHASRDLRELSNRRDVASSVPGHLRGSAPGTPRGAESPTSSHEGVSPRHRTRATDSGHSTTSTPLMRAPPSYRLPPHPGGLQETSFSHDSPVSMGSGRFRSGRPMMGISAMSPIQPPPPPFMHSGYGGGTVPVGDNEL